MTETLTFPPLMYGEEVAEDALSHAARRAVLGCDAGLVVYALAPTHVEAALVFVPEVTLAKAMVMLPLCGIGLQNALGALAPPEVAIYLDWDGGIRVNGAACGRLSVRTSDDNPDAELDWLVVGFSLPLMPSSDDMGHTPDQTALYAEGCADIRPPVLIEAWARHTLNWIARWEAEGNAALHREWRGLAHGVGEPTEQRGKSGTFLGVDEDFGMLLRDEDGNTEAIPLTSLLETSE